jgi:L-gulonolactone oxidase
MGGFTRTMVQQLLGRGVWHNWMGNLSCKPALIFRPRSKEELSAIVKRAAKDGRKVRLYGAKHSWMPLAPTDDYLVDTCFLRRGLAVDEANKTVRVETGMTVGELTSYAADNGLFISSPTVATQFTVGGLVATASHGTGLDVATFADTVVSFTVVRADGEIVEVTADRLEMRAQGGEDLSALRCSLGALGIIYAVTVKCLAATNCRVQNIVKPLDEAIAAIPDVIAQHNGVEMFWFPFAKTAVFRTIDPVDDPVTYGWWQKFVAEFTQKVLEGTLGELGLFVVTKVAPSLTPWMTWFGSLEMSPCDWVMSPIDAYHYQYYYPKVWDSEFAIPVEHAPKAFQAYVDLVQRYADQGQYPVNLVVHARFTDGDNTLLSPDFGRKSCYIESVTAKGTPNIDKFYGDAEDMLMSKFDGRPHWAKVWYDMDRVRRCYDTNLRRFETVRAKWDPNGVFLNDFLTKLFAPLDPAVVRPHEAQAATVDAE